MTDYHVITPRDADLVMRVDDGVLTIIPPTGEPMDDITQDDIPAPNPDLIQDQGRIRLDNLLETGNRSLLDQPPVDTTKIPPPDVGAPAP